MNTKDFKRWSDKVQFGTKDECWEWQASKNKMGYGQMTCGGRLQLAHRLAYNHFNAMPLGTFMCCHTCDNPSCVNPNHLFAGTQKDNMDDCVRKGRLCPHNKLLTDAERDLIYRFRRRVGVLDFLASWFGVSRNTIRHIRSGARRSST